MLRPSAFKSMTYFFVAPFLRNFFKYKLELIFHKNYLFLTCSIKYASISEDKAKERDTSIKVWQSVWLWNKLIFKKSVGFEQNEARSIKIALA